MSRRDQSPDINEQSPLIGPERHSEDDDVEEQALSDDFDLSEPIVEQKGTLYYILLTLSLAGLQIVWSVELAAGTPYLASLGMSKALIAFVWVAGPVTGVLVSTLYWYPERSIPAIMGKTQTLHGGRSTWYSRSIFSARLCQGHHAHFRWYVE